MALYGRAEASPGNGRRRRNRLRRDRERALTRGKRGGRHFTERRAARGPSLAESATPGDPPARYASPGRAREHSGNDPHPARQRRPPPAQREIQEREAEDSNENAPDPWAEVGCRCSRSVSSDAAHADQEGEQEQASVNDECPNASSGDDPGRARLHGVILHNSALSREREVPLRRNTHHALSSVKGRTTRRWPGVINPILLSAARRFRCGTGGSDASWTKGRRAKSETAMYSRAGVVASETYRRSR